MCENNAELSREIFLNRKWHKYFFYGLTVFFLPTSVYAGCTAVWGDSLWPKNPLVIQTGTPNGTVIETLTITRTINCDPDGADIDDSPWLISTDTVNNRPSEPTSIPDVRKLSLEGLGVRITSTSSGIYGKTIVWSEQPFNAHHFFHAVDSTQSTRITITDIYEYIKVGDIKSGSVDNFVFYYDYAKNNTSNAMSLFDNYIQATRVETAPGCNVIQPDMNVFLGDFNKSDFTGVGSSSPRVPVPIQLDCDPGVRANITVSGVLAEGGSTNVLALTDSGQSAKNIGIELFYWGFPLRLNTAQPLGLALNGGLYTLDIEANYRQIGLPVTAGSANAMATFVITYQ